MSYHWDAMELESVSRAELLAIIARLERIVAELRAQLAAAQQRIAELESVSRAEPRELATALARIAELESQQGRPPAPPTAPPTAPSPKAPPEFVKPNTPPKEPKPREKRSQNFARKRATPTDRVFHAYDVCPDCSGTLLGGSVKRTREVLHIPIVPAQVIEHAYVERHCPTCHKDQTPKVDLSREVVGEHRVSAQTMAAIATLREVGRLPVRAIRWLLGTFHQLWLSIGEIVEILHVVREQTAGLREELKAEVRGSSVVHGDETGWRENGQNGYLWTFSTPTIRYFLHRTSRAGAVVKEVLGEQFEGVLVSDFYAAYNIHQGEHQRCWPHLIRDIQELVKQWPEDKEVEGWAKGVQEVYRRARDWVRANPQANESERVKAQRQFEGELQKESQPYLGREVPQRVLCERLERFLPELFTFVKDPRVPSDNNAAERALRPVVISRKISGGTRSEKGSETKSALATVFGTWLTRGQNPFLACLAAITSP